MWCQLGWGLVSRQELNAGLLAANSAGRRADAATWLDLGLERLTSLGGALGRPLGGPLAACTALVDLSATANQLTCIQGMAEHCIASSCHSKVLIRWKLIRSKSKRRWPCHTWSSGPDFAVSVATCIKQARGREGRRAERCVCQAWAHAPR